MPARSGFSAGLAASQACPQPDARDVSHAGRPLLKRGWTGTEHTFVTGVAGIGSSCGWNCAACSAELDGLFPAVLEDASVVA
jgi:hypothetical protein